MGTLQSYSHPVVALIVVFALVLASCAGKTAPPSSLGIRGMDRPEFKRYWGEGEVEYLPSVLKEGEVVKYVVDPWLDGVGDGLLVATDSRLLFLDKSRSGVTKKEYAYDKITYVSYKKDAVFGKVFLFEDGYRSVFESLDHSEAEGFARYITWFIQQELGVDVSKKGREDRVPADQPMSVATGSGQDTRSPSTTSPSEPAFASPTDSALPKPEGIGVTRHAIQSVFEKPDLGGFVFEVAPLADGRPRVLAYSEERIATIELIGPERNLSRAYMSVGLPSDRPDLVALNSLSLILFMAHAAPSWKEEGVTWMKDNLETVKTQEEVHTTHGHLEIAMKYYAWLGTLSISIGVGQE